MKELLINVATGEECRIALLEDEVLEELYMERTSATSHVGNIYKGKVTNVEASIQAAFVDFGLGRNGFLHISDLMPTYFGRKGDDSVQESVGRKMARRDRPPIQRCLRRGDEIIVQIIKEGIGTKGPTLSTYLSIPGKMLVMMPGMGKMGVSKKIEDEQERRRLRQILDGLKPPKGVAFIIRTAGVGKTKLEIERDLKYLTRLWEQIEKKQEEPGPVELYTEGDLVTRTVRDLFSADVDRIVVDDKDVAKRVKDVIKISSPRAKNKVDVYEEPIPLFHRFGIEKEIEQMYSRYVPLPSGGSLVIDSTEAIVAIDVNSGKNRDNNDAEMTAFKTDMEAADEIPRQLKLRDLGGVIIVDFIDLRYERHRRELEERLHENFKRDRAKTKVLRMSQFGIIELTRQRMRPSLKRSIYFDCPHCKGAGLVKTVESMSLDIMRKLAIALADLKVARAELSVCNDVAVYLLNSKRIALSALEEKTGKKILIRMDASLGLDEQKFSLFDDRDGAVVLESIGMTTDRPHTTQLGHRPAGHTHQGRGKRSGSQRGSRNDQRGRNDNRPAPQDEESEGPENSEDDRDEDFDSGDARLEMTPGREEDSPDLPQILETESGDEIAEELADEHTGEAGPDASGDAESQEDRRPPQQNRPQQQGRYQQGRQQNDNRDQRDQRDNRDNRGGHDNRNNNRDSSNRDNSARDGRPVHQNRPPVQNRDQSQDAPVEHGEHEDPNDRQPSVDPRGADGIYRGQQGGGGGRYGQNRQGGQGQQNFQGGGGGRRRRRGRRGRGGQGGGQFNDNGNGNFGGQVPPPRDPDEPMTLAERLASELANAGHQYADEHDTDGPVDEGNGPIDENGPMEPNAPDGAERPFDPNAPVDEDGPRRRRRRRGGRRHRRRNGGGEFQDNGQNGPGNGNAPSMPTPSGDALFHGDGSESDEFTDTDTDTDTETDDNGDESTSADASSNVRMPIADEPRQEEPAATLIEPITEPEPAVEDNRFNFEPDPEPEVVPAPKRGKSVKKTVKKTRTAVKRVAPKSAKGKKGDPLPQVAEPEAVVRTGSSDAHLGADEPIEAPRVSRPRSYSDLDAIPDDFD